MRNLMRVGLLVGAAGFAAGGACKEPLSEEDRVKAVIRKAIAAANEKKAGEVVEDAADGFKGPRGADVRECRRILTGYFLRQGWVRGFERSVDVEVNGDRAEAKLEVVVARGRPVQALEDIVPEQASRLAFDLKLVRQEDAWRFIEATYRQRPFVTQ